MSMGGITCVVIADHAVLKRCFAKEEFCGSAPLGMLRRIMRVRYSIFAEFCSVENFVRSGQRADLL